MQDKFISLIPMYDNGELIGIIKTNGAGKYEIYKVEVMSNDELADFIVKYEHQTTN